MPFAAGEQVMFAGVIRSAAGFSARAGVLQLLAQPTMGGFGAGRCWLRVAHSGGQLASSSNTAEVSWRLLPTRRRSADLSVLVVGVALEGVKETTRFGGDGFGRFVEFVGDLEDAGDGVG